LEEGHGQKRRLVIYEIPYMVNKAELVSQIAQLIRDRNYLVLTRSETKVTGRASEWYWSSRKAPVSTTF